MNELTYTLLQLWVFWYSSAAFFGAFLGASLALWIHRKIQKRRERRG